MISSLGIQCNTLLSAGPAFWELRASAGLRPRVLTIDFCSGTNGPGSVQLAFATIPGVNPVKNYFAAEDMPSQTSLVWAAVSWLIPPVLSTTIASGVVYTAYLRRFSYGNPSNSWSQGIVWTFPHGLVVPSGVSLCLWTTTSVTTPVVNCVVEE